MFKNKDNIHALRSCFFRVKYSIMKKMKGPLFFVESHCIECNTCSELAGTCFKIDFKISQAVVFKQPANAAEQQQCREAESSCPVGAIQHEN